eukprot:TRINITY_DN324_c0_g1_i7.p1 TRINITY_DN324_c0_g1~~TRINITY_DN324_c0_g1_i7.p1  ORF type:complete len:216 (+),score=59.98 TRINITY_DN324_c0_g1_i7:46-648(+)
MLRSLVGSEMCIRDSTNVGYLVLDLLTSEEAPLLLPLVGNHHDVGTEPGNVVNGVDPVGLVLVDVLILEDTVAHNTTIGMDDLIDGAAGTGGTVPPSTGVDHIVHHNTKLVMLVALVEAKDLARVPLSVHGEIAGIGGDDLLPGVLHLVGMGVVGDGEGKHCLLYTSDAADEEDSVDLGGRRIIKKKKKKKQKTNIYELW